MRIAERMLRCREYVFSLRARRKLLTIIQNGVSANGNARWVRNMVERAIRLHAVRILGRYPGVSRQQLMTIEPEDIQEVDSCA
jgi:stage V sporulation protein K